MGREQEYRNAAQYFIPGLEDEDVQETIRKRNAEIQIISDLATYTERVHRSGTVRSGAPREIVQPLSPIFAPKVSRKQARENIAAFNRGVDAMPKVVGSYVSNTSPREMLSDAGGLVLGAARSAGEDPGGAILDAVPIVSTYRAFEEVDRLNRAASDARKAGDFATADKLEALSAYTTATGTLGVLPVLGLLRRLNRAIPAGGPEIPTRFLKDKPPPVPDSGTVKRALAQGFTSRKADYLGLPYNGMGHHFIPRRIGDKFHIPDWYMESRFNVLKPNGISIGDMYDLHYRVDPSFHGTGLPARSSVGGGSWKGAELGIEKYGIGGRLWHGSPAELKYLAGTLGAGGYWLLSDDE